MSGRAVAAETAALAAVALWVYAGTALAVASVGEGASLSFGAAAAVVVASYGLVRVLQRFDLAEEPLRLWGAALSLGLLYLILRVQIAGEPYLWELGWLGDLLSEPGPTLEGHGGAVTAVLLLGAAWARGAIRGSRELTSENVMSEVTVGAVIVLIAAAAGPGADAPGALRWLPVPYLAMGFLALALMHLLSVEADPSRPFAQAWAQWTGGSVAAIAGIAFLATLFDPTWLDEVGRGLATGAQGAAIGVAYAVTPLILGIGWVAQLIAGWLISGDEFFIPEQFDPGALVEEQEAEEESEPARWSLVLGRVLRSGLVVLAVVAGLAILWLVFKRRAGKSNDDSEAREDVTTEAGGPLGDLRALLAGAFGRFGRGAPGRKAADAIGRLYFSVLDRAETEGLARPAAATPLEFGPQLDEHFRSPLPSAISRAYAEARYGGRLPQDDETGRLRASWDQLPPRET